MIFTGDKYDLILDSSINNIHVLNDDDMTLAINLLEYARLLGWYPFVSEVYSDLAFIEKYEAVTNIKKDEILFEILMLESEVDILSEFSDVNIEEIKILIHQIKSKYY